MALHRAKIQLTPSLIIGCGGRGSAPAAWCRRLMLQEVFKNERELNNYRPIRFVFLDSVPQKIEETNEILTEQTISFNFGEGIHKIIGNPNFPDAGASVQGVGSLFPPNRGYKEVQEKLVNAVEGNNTCPPIGRMNLLGSWDNVYNELKHSIFESWGGGSPVQADDSPQVFILAGLYGGTGAGIHLDTAAMVRAICTELELPQPQIHGIFFLPDLQGNIDKLRANAYASLREIDHYMMRENAYVLRMANGQEVRVTQEKGDFLYSNVFLVNDRNQINGAPGVKLKKEEAAQMAGEVLFHWIATEVGAEITKRLVDSPLTLSKEEVPQGKSERRIRAYSTFGCATVTIPYTEIGQNLTVHLAHEVMNDLLCRPDHQTAEEFEEVRRQKEEFYREFPIERLCKVLNLTEKDLNKHMRIKLPQLLSGISPKEVPDFVEFCNNNGYGKDVPRALSEITGQVQELLNQGASDVAEEQQKFIREFKKKLTDKTAKMLTAGGPDLAATALHRLLNQIEHMINRYNEFDTADQTAVSKALGRMREVRSTLSGVSAIKRPISRDWKESLEELSDGLFSRLIQKTTGYCKGLQREKFISVLLEFKRCVTEEEMKLSGRSKRYDKVLEKLKQKMTPYTTDKLHLSIIPEHHIEGFIESFPFPPEVQHDALADTLREEGLAIDTPTGQRIIKVHEFDRYPDQVADALFCYCQRVVNEYGTDLLSRCWSESGFYPLTYTDATEWDLYSYSTTYNKLKEQAGPYLEYNDNHGFTTHKLAFIINPHTDVPAEESKWQELAPTDVHQSNSFTGVGETSPYSLTLLRFDCALPLYSIDGIAEWHKDYENILHHTNRPLHKFKEYESFKEPYATFTEPKELTEGEIESLYNWAEEISRSSLYPIFSVSPTVCRLRSMEPVALDYYYATRCEVYLEKEKVLAILAGSATLKQETVTMMLNLLQHEPSLAVEEPFKSFQEAMDPQSEIEKVISALTDQQNLESDFIKIDNGRLHFVTDQFVAARPLVRGSFEEKVESPALRTGITHADVKRKIHRDPMFRKTFLDLIGDAIKYMDQRGVDYPSLPVTIY